MKFLRDTDLIIDQLHQFILSNSKSTKSNTSNNYFIFKGKKIYLDYNNCNCIYDFLLNMNNEKLMKSLDKGTKNFFNKLKDDININYENISKANDLFKYIDKAVFIKVLLKVLSYEIYNSYKVYNDIKIPISSISRNLGRNFTYIVLHNFYLHKLDKLKSSIKLDHMSLKYKELKNNIENLSKEEMLLYLYLSKYETPNNDTTTRRKIRADLSVHYLKIGTTIFSELVNCKILNSQKNNSGVEILQVEDFLQNINLNSFFLMPYLTAKKPKINPFKQSMSNNSFFNLELNSGDTDENLFSSTFKKKNQYTDIFLYEASSVKYCIKEQVLDDFLLLLDSAFFTDVGDIKENSFINTMFKIIYDFDLDEFQILDDLLKKELIQYAFNFDDTKFNCKLKAKCSVSVTLSTLYNKITSYKYIIKAFLIQAKIFSKFGFFFIPKYLTSSGRLYSRSYLIQRQSLKLIKNLIFFFNTNTINTKNYKYLKNQFNILPNEYNDYLKQQKDLFLDYINSNLIENANISTYYTLKNIKDKVIWISQHVEKISNIWLVYTLLQAYKNNELDICYEMDSTSSSYQLIGLLCGDRSILEATNVIGDAKRDLYTEILDQVLEVLNNYTSTDRDYILINKFYKYLSRNIVKHCIMILGYSGTVMGQKNIIKENLKEIFITKNYSDYDDKELNAFSLLLVKQINKVCQEVLKGPLSALNFTKDNLRLKLKKKDKIQIDMPYLSYIFSIEKQKKTKCRMYFKDGKIQFVVYMPTGILDIRRMANSFFPILIHGVDAFIVQDIYLTIYSLNKLLKKHKLPLIYLSTNHDCFAINMQYNVLLKFLVRLSYNKVSDLSIVKDWFVQKEKLKCTNPNFIKH